MTDDDWFDWQMQMLFERFERFAEMLRSQLSVAESLFEEAQAWFFPTHADVQKRPTGPARTTRFVPQAPEIFSSLSSSAPGAVGRRSLDEIVAEAQQVLDSSLREAFTAGRRHITPELRRKMEALFEELAEGDRAHQAARAPETRSSEQDDNEE
jgi:hypothetical protein